MTEKKPDLSDQEMTTSEFLIKNSDAYQLHGRVDPSRDRRSLTAGMAIIPTNSNLPEASISATGGGSGPESASLSVGSDLLRHSRRWDYLPKGLSTMDTVEGALGPVRAHYRKSLQPGNQGSRTTDYGASLNLGPVDLFGQRSTSSRDVVDPRDAQYFKNTRFDQKTDTFGARGSLPVGSGTLTGDVSRQYGTSRSPQRIGQDARPMVRNPHVTNYGLGWKGPVGQGILNIHGGARHVRGVGVEPSVEAEWKYKDPFGLGGQFRARGSLVKPLDSDQNTATEGLFRYTLPF